MSDAVLPSLGDLSASEAKRVEQACQGFEAAWQGGTSQPRPRLEDFLGEAMGLARSVLLCELLLLEMAYRRRQGATLTAMDYLQRFAGEECLLRNVFGHLGVPWESVSIPIQETQAEYREAGKETPTSLLRVPGYDLLGKLGEGAMGVVYRARHRKLNRVVALKMIRAGANASEELLRRFQSEAKAVARMQHPHIVQLFEVGEAEGRPFFALECVEGISLERRLREAPLTPTAAAELVLLLARAMDWAHAQGIIHRDLKPANILLTSDGSPKIADFGLAKRLEEGASETQTGAIVGTPSYMAPEQAEGRSKDVGPAADVYALGAILYECLTGRPPFRAATLLDTLEQVRSATPVAPGSLQPKTPRDLEAITLKCLEKESSRRYHSAGELGDDLRRFLNGDPPKARLPGLVGRLVRTIERELIPKETLDYSSWATVWFRLAPIVGSAHLVIFFLALKGQEVLTAWVGIVRGIQVLLMVAVWMIHRWPRVLAATAPERLLLTAVVGHTISCCLIQTVVTWMPSAGLMELNLYPIWTIVSALVFLILGSTFWGRCYLFALVFFAASLLMPLELLAAPLVYGFLWMVVLMATSWQLRKLKRQGR